MGWQGLPISTTWFGRKPSRQLTQFASGHRKSAEKRLEDRPLPVKIFDNRIENNVFLDSQPLPSYRKAKFPLPGRQAHHWPGSTWTEMARTPFWLSGFEASINDHHEQPGSLKYDVSQFTTLPIQPSGHALFSDSVRRTNTWHEVRIEWNLSFVEETNGNFCIGLLPCIVPPGT